MAAGMDLPAFRSIIRDLKRYTHHGMDYIPTLEYHQCAGRAGRPGKEEYGEAIIIAKDEADKEEITERFIHGKPENIYSKLAVEPVLRMYVLSLIVSGIVINRDMLYDFFSRTFWARQYKDMDELKRIIEKMIELLRAWEFLERENDGFVPADEISVGKLKATVLGERVAQLYIDPLTANFLINGIRKTGKEVSDFALLQIICNTLEMRPRLSVKAREFEEYENLTAEVEDELLIEIPSYFEHEYNEFMDSIKTARMFYDWVNEEDEDFLLGKYNIRPGETRIKLSMADWLLYSMKELAMILDKKWICKEIEKIRIRLEYGVKEELLNLLRLKNIGRVRARKLYANGVKTVGDLKKTDISLLSKILGEKTAENVKKQVGQDDFEKNERL
jgi:helicase